MEEKVSTTHSSKTKIKLWRLLEKYDIWRDYKFGFIKKQRRDELFRDFMDLLRRR